MNGLTWRNPLIAGAIALVLRLPTAENTPGKLVWTVMGTDTVTILQALTYSATVMTVAALAIVLRVDIENRQLMRGERP